MARDAFSFLHLPLVAGIVLLALGVKKTLGDVGEPLQGRVGGRALRRAALYLAAGVAFRRRCLGALDRSGWSRPRCLRRVMPLALAARRARGARRRGGDRARRSSPTSRAPRAPDASVELERDEREVIETRRGRLAQGLFASASTSAERQQRSPRAARCLRRAARCGARRGRR